MSKLTLEVGREPRSTACPDCGGTATTTAGYIYLDVVREDPTVARYLG